MEMTELPILKRNQYSERITLAVSPEMKMRLDKLKSEKQVNTPELLRSLIKEFLAKVG